MFVATTPKLSLRRATAVMAPIATMAPRSAFSAAHHHGPCCACGPCSQSRLMATSRRFYCAKKTDAKADAKAAEEPEIEDSPHQDQAHKRNELKDNEKDEEIKKLKSELLYALADAENARRVAAEDVRKARDYSVKDFAKDMCDVIDALERATMEVSKLSDDDKGRLKNVTHGIELTRSVLVHNLERHGVRKIKADVGDVFDYNTQEALYNHQIKEGEKLKPGQIACVVKTGYMLQNRILRAAQVGVAQAPDQ